MQSVVAWPNSYLDSAIMAGDKDAFVYITISVKIKDCVYICDPVGAFVRKCDLENGFIARNVTVIA